jgi:phage shock protein B
MVLLEILALVFVLIVAGIVGGIILAIVKLARGGESAGSLPQEEARLMQEIHQNLERMEKRLEALETIVLEPQRRGQAATDSSPDEKEPS